MPSRNQHKCYRGRAGCLTRHLHLRQLSMLSFVKFIYLYTYRLTPFSLSTACYIDNKNTTACCCFCYCLLRLNSANTNKGRREAVELTNWVCRKTKRPVKSHHLDPQFNLALAGIQFCWARFEVSQHNGSTFTIEVLPCWAKSAGKIESGESSHMEWRGCTKRGAGNGLS